MIVLASHTRSKLKSNAKFTNSVYSEDLNFISKRNLEFSHKLGNIEIDFGMIWLFLSSPWPESLTLEMKAC